MSRQGERMVSTAILRERRAAIEADIDSQRRVRADDDPFFRITAWLLAEWEAAEREAAKQYVPTAEAARLSGWSEQTLRKYAARVRDGEELPEGWGELRARADGSEWSFCLSTIPVKSTRAA